MDKEIDEILEKLEQKRKESSLFIKKYEERKMSDLEEYYKDVDWAFSWSIKQISETFLKK